MAENTKQTPPTKSSPQTCFLLCVVGQGYASCPHNSRSYTDFKRRIKSNPCMSESEAWQQLSEVYYSDCKAKIIQEMYDQELQAEGSTSFGSLLSQFLPTYHQTTKCYCSSSAQTVPTWKLSLQNQTGQCLRLKHFTDIFHTYQDVPPCKTHHHIWKDLHYFASNRDCVNSVTSAVATAMKSVTCTCSSSNPAHISSHSIQCPHGSRSYTDFVKSMDAAPCMSEAQAWNHLSKIYYSGCKEKAIKYMYNKTRSSSDNCNCNDVGISNWNLQHPTNTNCVKYQQYNDMFKAYSQAPTCQSHDHIWNYLNGFANDQSCVNDVITTIGGAMKSTSCACSKSNAKDHTPQQVPPTSNCDALQVVSGVAHNAPAGSTLSCPDKHHAEAYTFVTNSCTGVHYSRWSRGVKVKDHCSTLPRYTAIGHFVNSHIDRDYQSANTGVFVGCENGYFKMVTEDCHTNLHVEHISFNDPESNNYYAIHQQT